MVLADPKLASHRPRIETFAVLFSYGFRPLFLVAAAYALVAMLVWLSALSGWWVPAFHQSPTHWHVHEMLFGFGEAAVGGFLLTAVPNWTGRPVLKGVPLILLVGAWLLGRLAMCWSFPPGLYTVAVGVLYPWALAGIVGAYVISVRNSRNYHVVVVVAALAATDTVYQLGVAGYFAVPAGAALTLALHVLLLLLVIISGRVVPAFTGNWLKSQHSERLPVGRPWLERLVIPITVFVALADSWFPGAWVTGILALSAALVHGTRLIGWQGMAVRSQPLLFVLHAGYLWLVVGYFLLGTAALGYLAVRGDAIHALTIGAIGTMALALMTRASLGHTGRALRAPAPLVLAYWVVTVAAMLRLLGGWMPSINLALLTMSGALWMLAYLLFLVCFAPILLQPRIDG